MWCHTDGGPSHDCLIDTSSSAQTGLVSYLRPTLSELSSVHHYLNEWGGNPESFFADPGKLLAVWMNQNQTIPGQITGHFFSVLSGMAVWKRLMKQKQIVSCIYLVIFNLIKITYSVTIVTSVPWDTERVLRLVKTHMGKCLFFSWTEVLFNHAVKLHDYWFVQV